ncbi:hypothetical protein ON010_g19073 [Phytophthora cinnamomi]|nr:hypothetical protein ON010_g19073 [Phytophthora cinnamomi]
MHGELIVQLWTQQSLKVLMIAERVAAFAGVNVFVGVGWATAIHVAWLTKLERRELCSFGPRVAELGTAATTARKTTIETGNSWFCSPDDGAG